MNWMTSGRKRVKRSQKAKELRAKHFSKVAADRVRAPVSQQVRPGGSLSSRQSADVSRLKSRWTQQPTSVQAPFPQPGRRAAASSSTPAPPAAAEGVDAAYLASAASPVGPGTTTPDSGSLLPGLLELDVTPPFATASRRRQHGGGGGVASTTEAGLAAANPTRESSAHQLFRQQEPAARHHPRATAAALHAEPPAAFSPRHHERALERRQLIFGGRDGAAGRPGAGEDYERQPLGSEGAGDCAGTVPADIQHPADAVAAAAAAAAAAGAGEPSPASQRGLFGQEWGRPMRFFNAGVEVAHDGSPVLSTVAASSPPPRPPPPLARFSAGRLGFSDNERDNNNARDSDAPFGVTGSGEVCGLPRFSTGALPGDGDRPPSTPSELWAQSLPPEGHADPYAPNSHFRRSRSASDREQPRSDSEQPRSSRAAADTHMYSYGQPGYGQPGDAPFEDEGCDELLPDDGLDAYPEEDHVLLEEEPRDLSRDAASPVSAGFEVLARTWGLFGGALCPPQDSTPATAVEPPATATSPPPRPAPSALGSDGAADARGAGVERAAEESGDGRRAPPVLQVSIPVRATPHVTSSPPGHHHYPGQMDDPEASWRTPPPRALSGGDDDPCGDGGGSPELTMLFTDEPEGRGPEEAAAGHAGTEALEGERRVSEPATLPPASPPLAYSLAGAGPPGPHGRQTAPDSSQRAPGAAAEGTRMQQDERTSLATDATPSIIGFQQQLDPDVDGPARAEAAPELAAARRLAKVDQQPGDCCRRPGGGPDESTIDAVSTILLPGGLGDRGSRPPLPLPMGPAVSGAVAPVVDAAQASSMAAAAAAATHVPGNRSTTATTTAVEGGSSHAAGGRGHARPPHRAARLGLSSPPEDAPRRTPSQAVGVSSSSSLPSPERLGAPASSQSEKGRKRARRGGQQEKGRGERCRHKGGPVPTVTATVAAAVGDHGAPAGKASTRGSVRVGERDGGGGGGGRGGRGGGLALKAATGVGPEEVDGGGGRDEEDAYSTIVWYRTVVACLTAAVSRQTAVGFFA